MYTAVYTRVHGGLQVVYTAVTRPCTDREHGCVHVSTAVYKAVHVHGPCKRLFMHTAHVHGSVHVYTTTVYTCTRATKTAVYVAVYTAVYGRSVFAKQQLNN